MHKPASPRHRRVVLWLMILLTPFAALAAQPSPQEKPVPEDLPALPVEIASFGAALAEDTLYVYGGHVGTTHQHSVQNLSRGFYSLDLTATDAGWTEHDEVRGLQGLAMVAAGKWVCRIGGMEARNDQDAPEDDLHSVDEVACFDSEGERWVPLPPLSAGRSSHDAVVSGSRIYAVGGWQLRGEGNEPVWHDTIEVIDMAGDRQWRTLPQPFKRRALTAAAHGGKIYAFGGLGPNGTTLEFAVFDEQTESWTDSGSIPEMSGAMRGFGISAFGVEDGVYLSANDGKIHFLQPDLTWLEDLAEMAEPRFFHRLLPYRDRLLAVAGASREGHLGSVESIALGESPTAMAEDRAAAAVRWPGFRGAGAEPLAPEELPIEWDDATWRIALTGYGQSSPVIWGGQVFVTAIEGDESETLILSAIDLKDGSVRWRRLFEASQPHENSHMHSRAAPTPVVDANAVYAFWESGDLVALSHQGETLWSRSLTAEEGEFKGNHGVGSSPVLAGGLLVVQVTHSGPSYFMAFDPATGETRWKLERPEGVAWTTPIAIDTSDAPYLVSSAAGRVELIDAEKGAVVWSVGDIEKNHVPSVVASWDMIVAPSSDPGQSLALAVRPDAWETPPEVLWRPEGVASGFGSPVIHGDGVLFLNKSGVLQKVNKKTGELEWRHRLPAATWATPIAVADRVYFFLKDGNTAVLALDDQAEPRVLAENAMSFEDPVYGVAPTANGFVLRSGSELALVREAERQLAATQ